MATNEATFMSLQIDKIVRLNRSILEQIRNEEKLQGHFLTGNLDASLEGKEFIEAGKLVLEGYAASYIKELEERQSASQISISETERQELIKWVILRGMASDIKEGTAIADAIIRKWEFEGRPTENSKLFSKTGERTGAIEKVLVANDDKLLDLIGKTIDEIFEPIFKEQLSEIV